jgi:hypothetical protein
MADGGDVTFGSNPGSTFASVSYSIVKGQVVEAVVWIRAKDASASSIVDLYLLEPWE